VLVATVSRAIDGLVNVSVGPGFWGDGMYPQSLLHYMATRGKAKIIFASDSPVLSITRTVSEASGPDLEPEALDNYLYGNADRFFFHGGGSQ
jgi:uncharacterized protein